jgi:hypothetical protein
MFLNNCECSTTCKSKLEVASCTPVYGLRRYTTPTGLGFQNPKTYFQKKRGERESMIDTTTRGHEKGGPTS